jgi:hypothetical protein
MSKVVRARLDKLARNLEMLGMTVDRTTSSVIVDNGSNDLTITYVDADILSPMGGVDDTQNPFLGIGIANPGKLRIEGEGINSANAATVGDLIDSEVAAQVLAMVVGSSNDVQLAQANAGAGADLETEIRGHADLLGMGQ